MKNLKKLKIQKDFCIEGNVLDIGFAQSPNQFLKDVTGLDILLPAEIPENYKKVIKCDLNKEKIPFLDEEFANVIAGDVIEHLENPSSFLREVNRILKKDGRLILSTPQANDWWTTLHNWFFRSMINDPDSGEHLQNWTFLDMIRLLKKSGFKVEKIEGYYMHFPKINFKIRVKNFPALSWQVFYIATKIDNPDKTIITQVDGKRRRI